MFLNGQLSDKIEKFDMIKGSFETKMFLLNGKLSAKRQKKEKDKKNDDQRGF